MILLRKRVNIGNMAQIIIKSEDPIHGHSTKSFTTRAEAEAYMDSIGLVVPAPEEPAVEPEVEEPEVTPEPEKVKAKPAVKHSKSKRR